MHSCQVAVAKLGEVLGKLLNCRGAKEILLVLGKDERLETTHAPMPDCIGEYTSAYVMLVFLRGTECFISLLAVFLSGTCLSTRA